MKALTKASQLKRPRYKRAKRIVREVVAVKVCRDGREICDTKTPEGRAEYGLRLKLMLARQAWQCGICEKGLTSEYATFDHELGRGMNGGFRDDRIVVDGKQFNRAVHLTCNIEKGSKRGYR